MRIPTVLVLVLMIVSPTTYLFPNPPQRDVPAEVDSARQALKGALNDLQHAGSEWGGHRAAAMHHIDEALKELNEAEKFFHQHHEEKK